MPDPPQSSEPRRKSIVASRAGGTDLVDNNTRLSKSALELHLHRQYQGVLSLPTRPVAISLVSGVLKGQVAHLSLICFQRRCPSPDQQWKFMTNLKRFFLSPCVSSLRGAIQRWWRNRVTYYTSLQVATLKCRQCGLVE